MQSRAFDTFIEDLCKGAKADVLRCFENSFCLSADVSNGYDLTIQRCRITRIIQNLTMASRYANTPEPEAKAVPATRPRSLWKNCEPLLTKQSLSGRRRSIWQGRSGGRRYRGPSLWRTATSTRWTQAFRFCPCNAPYEVISKLDLYMTYKAVKAFC
jgi:hypothetical protein